MDEIEKIIKENEFNPQQIGIKLLELKGYKVETFRYSNSVYVYDKEDKEKLLYWYSDPNT